jgi:hypothetical protein
MKLIEIIRSEIMAYNAVILMLLRKPRKNGRKHYESQNLK